MICAVFYNSGFKRTLCGSKWDTLSGSKSAFNNLGSGSTISTARHGCCPAGKYMSSPEVNPFLEANSCSACPTGQSVYSAVLNDETSCQPNICTCPNGTPTLSTGSAGTLCITTSMTDCSACVAGFRLSATPVAAGQQTCISCVAGSTYKQSTNSDSSCKTCLTTCDRGKRFTACSTTADRSCPSCGSGQYQNSNSHASTSCKSCSTSCGSGKRFTACSATADRSCPSCVAGSIYQDTSSHTDTSCKTCSPCASGTTMTAECTTTTNRQCTGNTCTCDNGTPTITGGTASTLCETDSTKDCSKCDVGYKISATAGLGLQICNAKACTATQVLNSNKATPLSITGT